MGLNFPQFLILLIVKSINVPFVIWRDKLCFTKGIPQNFLNFTFYFVSSLYVRRSTVKNSACSVDEIYEK